MFRNRNDEEAQVVDLTTSAIESDPALRDEVDPDPVVEEAVQRLRNEVSRMVAFDSWGRPLAWRHIVRIAVGPMIGDLRDSQTAARIGQALAEPPAAVEPQPVAVEQQEPVAAPSAAPAEDWLSVSGLGWPS